MGSPCIEKRGSENTHKNVAAFHRPSHTFFLLFVNTLMPYRGHVNDPLHPFILYIHWFQFSCYGLVTSIYPFYHCLKTAAGEKTSNFQSTEECWSVFMSFITLQGKIHFDFRLLLAFCHHYLLEKAFFFFFELRMDQMSMHIVKRVSRSDILTQNCHLTLQFYGAFQTAQQTDKVSNQLVNIVEY